ncbi:MAG: peptidase S9 [Bacteroidota bacterium]
MLRFSILLLFVGLAISPARAQYFAFGKNRVQYEDPDWRYVQSEHFDVYYYERESTAPGGRVLAEFAAEAAEEAYREIVPLFSYQLTRRVPLLIYPTHPEFAVTNAVDLPVYAEGIGGVTELYKNRIAVPFTGDWRDFRRVIHHELVHAVVNDVYFGGSLQSLVRRGLRLNIPLWFNEGLAEYSALGWDTHSDMYVRDAVLNGELAPIPRLGGYFAYRGGQSVWDFIAEEYGREKVTEILERVRLGRSVPGAFRQATGISLNALSDRWHRTLRAVYFPEAAAREETEAVARPIATRQVTGAGYHTSPALSPQGDKVAYIASANGLFDVYVAPTIGRRPPKKLIDGQDNTQFESLRVLSPGLSWSPDGERLAVAVKSGSSDAIVLVEERTGRVETLRPDGVDAIVSVAWSPDGERIAFEGTAGAHSDLYVLELATERLINLTRDLFSDHAPAWAPDGLSLVFHSDRGDALHPGAITSDAANTRQFDAQALGRSDFDLYRVAANGTGLIERLTDDPVWDETDAALAVGPDGRERLLYVSDRNGIPNLYARDSLGQDRPRTDLQTGVMRLSLSADGSRAAILALDRGTPSVYLVRAPFGRDDLPDELVPTVWAQRRMGDAVDDAPSVQIASAVTRDRNPLLRDAADGAPPEPPARLPRPPSAAALARADSILNQLATRPPPGLLASRDTVALPQEAAAFTLDPYAPERGFRVNFRDYDFTDAFDEAVGERNSGIPDPFAISGHRDSTGALIPKRYKLAFTPDIVSAVGGYDTVYGVQSVTQMRFSDLMGDHRIAIATNLVLDLRNADYVLGYDYLPKRTDFRVQGFHLARELPDLTGNTIYRYRNYGLLANASYPLDKFRRLEGEVGLVGVSLSDFSDLGSQPRSRIFAVPRVTYSTDRTVPGFLGPQSGARWAASVSGAPGPDAFFATALLDGRRYWSLGPGYSLALRGSAGLSLGRDPQRFFAAGVENWIGAEFQSLPVRNEDDFVFATPVLPLRGFGYNEAAGDRFALANVEARVPLVAALLPGPLPILPLYNLQVVGFADAGVIAQGGVDVWDDGPVDPDTGEPGPRVLDDVLLGTGVGLRTIVLGYPVRLDWAWPYDGRQFGETRLYLSLGLDF